MLGPRILFNTLKIPIFISWNTQFFEKEEKWQNKTHLDHFDGRGIGPEGGSGHEFVGRTGPQPQQDPPVLLARDRLRLYRHQYRPVVRVSAHQVQVFLQKME